MLDHQKKTHQNSVTRESPNQIITKPIVEDDDRGEGQKWETIKDSAESLNSYQPLMNFSEAEKLASTITDSQVSKAKFQCKICYEAFTLKNRLRIHENNKHALAPRPLYPCPLDTCDKFFSEKGKLDQYLRTHAGDRPFECAQCGKTFTSLANQIDHERRHNQEK